MSSLCYGDLAIIKLFFIFNIFFRSLEFSRNMGRTELVSGEVLCK